MRIILLCVIIHFLSFTICAQSIGIGTNAPDNSAKLDIFSTDKGLLVPRMKLAERISIPQPANGLIVYQIDGSQGFYYNSGTPVIPAWLLLINSELAVTSVTASGPLISSGGNTPVLSLEGPGGSILYGTGPGSSFTPSGTSGNFLKSNGAAAPSWGLLGQSAQTVYGTSSVSITPLTLLTLIPGLTQTIVVPANSIVYIATDGGLSTTSTTSTGFSAVDIAITIDGTIAANSGYQRVIPTNTSTVIGQIGHFSVSQIVTLTPGSHTISIQAAGFNTAGSSNANVSGNSTSPLQAELSVVILKQ